MLKGSRQKDIVWFWNQKMVSSNHWWLFHNLSYPAWKQAHIFTSYSCLDLHLCVWSTAYNDLADDYGLVKLGGSDYHGRGGQGESDLGSVNLPVLAVHDFLKVARPIWCNAIRNILESYIKEPSDMNLEQITRFARNRNSKGGSSLGCGKDLIDLCLSSWLTNEERQNPEFEAIKLKFSNISINVPIESN